jgi:predicted transcriptional regulator of viral defense system
METMPTIWRGRDRVPVSSPERTIVDALVTPAWVGGIRHLAEILATYRREKSWRPERLLSELSTIGTGAAFKRLGFLLEALGVDESVLLDAAASRLSKGIVKLDPTIRGRGRLVKRWGLWANAVIRTGGSAE